MIAYQQRSPATVERELRHAREQIMRYTNPSRMRRTWELRRDALALELALTSPSVLRVGPL
jgi:hypothetical protein